MDYLAKLLTASKARILCIPENVDIWNFKTVGFSPLIAFIRILSFCHSNHELYIRIYARNWWYEVVWKSTTLVWHERDESKQPIHSEWNFTTTAAQYS